MNCIVTAGPTYEPLDDVRRLTNFSTGRLGTELANFLAARGHQVTLLVGTTATHAGERHAQTVKFFTTTADLRAKLKAFAGKNIDALFHAAAVSDFAFGRKFTRDTAGGLKAFAPSKKIPTRGGTLFIELVPTPKIIAELRGWAPAAQLVGWKFEADGGRLSVLGAARKQIANCATDACVANGPAYGRGFGIVTADGQEHFPSREKLFIGLERSFLK
jgi:phosphopantothenate---cysteine ligase (CTP)